MPQKRSIPRACRRCEREFFVDPSKATANRGLYCSIPCANKHNIRTALPPVPATVSADGLTATIPLFARDGSVHGHAIIDAADAMWASQWRWMLHGGYASRVHQPGSQRITLRLHRELLGLAYGDARTGDHINRDRLDNRRSNLRIVAKWAQAQNVSPRGGTSSKYRGVAWCSAHGKWRAYANVNGKPKHFGWFKTEAEAAQAAQDARLRHMPYTTE